jgi:hypothetical protein
MGDFAMVQDEGIIVPLASSSSNNPEFNQRVTSSLTESQESLLREVRDRAMSEDSELNQTFL